MGLLERLPEAATVFENLKPTHAVTLHPHQRERLHSGDRPSFRPAFIRDRLSDNIRSFHARMDRALLGPRWSNKPQGERLSGIWSMEHLDSAPHLHAALNVPERFHEAFDGAVQNAWQQLCPSGSVEVAPYRDNGWASYMTKDARSFDDLVFQPGA